MYVACNVCNIFSINMLIDQRNLIMSLRKLSSDDIFLHAVSSDAQANLEKTQT